jgi:hypothetical protein
MSADVDVWVKSCKVCRRRLPGNSRAPLIQEADSFFNQRVFIDLKGPLAETRRGMIWYLVCIDSWSKWTELIPLPDAEATTVYSAFYNCWVCHHGMSVQLHSDQGPNLVKSVGAAVADLLNIYRTRTVLFHPMGNGATERAVWNSIKVISVIIAEKVNSDPLEWDISCPKVALTINTSASTLMLKMPWLVKHSSCSKAILPVSIMADDLPSVQDVDVVVCNLQERQKRMFQVVSRATGVAQQRQKG